jgi:hypothetical protein
MISHPHPAKVILTSSRSSLGLPRHFLALPAIHNTSLKFPKIPLNSPNITEMHLSNTPGSINNSPESPVGYMHSPSPSRSTRSSTVCMRAPVNHAEQRSHRIRLRRPDRSLAPPQFTSRSVSAITARTHGVLVVKYCT